ncbi:MAG: hypothetical protein CSB48_11305 [Proteobacteria bacterium]|nr:MAG: hypothetical protein CSB48_11305 [Pseudomonadota bacterium]
MNESVSRTTDSLADIGSMLRRAREAKGISIKNVAEQLHLRPSVVQSLEVNDFSEINGDIFLKGYVKSYSALVGLPEGQVLPQLEQILLERNTSSQKASENVSEKAHRKSWILPALAVILVGAIAAWYILFGLTTREYTDPERFEVARETGSAVFQPENPASENPMPDNSLSEKAFQKPGLPDSPVAVLPGESADIPSPEPESGTGTEKETFNDASAEAVPVFSPPVNDTEMAQSTPPGENKTASEMPETDPISVVGDIGIEELQTDSDAEPVSTLAAIESKLKERIDSIRAEFDGDCWVQLKNGEGKTVVAALKRKGDVVKYTGPGPFTLVVGDATVTKLEFNGEPVNFNNHRVWKKRAELTLGQF